MQNEKLPLIFNYDFSDPTAEKPWRIPTSDMSDYFNYGFNEETWILYSDKVKKLNKRVENPI